MYIYIYIIYIFICISYVFIYVFITIIYIYIYIMNNILTQNDGNNQLGIGSNKINLVGIIDNTLDITQGTTSFMSISNSSGSEKISVKKPTTLYNNSLTITSTAKIEGAGCSPAFIFKGKDGKEQTLLLAGTVVKGRGCEGIAHGKFCAKGKSVAVAITGKIADGKFTGTKLVVKKK